MSCVRYVCKSTFSKCASLFTRRSEKKILPAAREPEEYEIIQDQSRNEQKTVGAEKQEEKWVADFESWNKHGKNQEEKKEVVSSPGKVMIGVDDDTIIKKKVNWWISNIRT